MYGLQPPMGFDTRKLQGWELHGKQSKNVPGIINQLIPILNLSVSFPRLLSFHHPFESSVAYTAQMSGRRRYGDATHKSAESRASVPRSNFCVVVKLCEVVV